jgi:flagellar basal body-associated protein FliL
MSEQEQELEQEPEQPESPPKKGKLPIVVILAGALLGGGLGAVLLGPVAAPLFAGFGGGEGGEDGESGGGEHGEAPPVKIHVVENMVVNPAGTQGMRLLLTSIAIDVGEDTRLIDAIVAAELELRGQFIHVFGRRTVSELADVSLREEITRELKAVTEEIIGKRVQRVFLPQFVLQ